MYSVRVHDAIKHFRHFRNHRIIIILSLCPRRPSSYRGGRAFERLNAIRNANTHIASFYITIIYCYYFNNTTLIRTGVCVREVCVSMRAVQRIPKNNDNDNNVNITNYHACLSAHCYYDHYARRAKHCYVIVKRGCYLKCSYQIPRPGDVKKSRSGRFVS